MRCFFVILIIIGATVRLAAQPDTESKLSRSQEISAVALEFGKPELTPLGKGGTIMSGNYSCASDGSIFLQITDSSNDMMLNLHSLKGSSEETKFSTEHIPGYKSISWPLNYSVNDKYVALLVEASPDTNPLEQNNSNELKTSYLILIYNRKGILEHVIHISSEIEPKEIGLYKSGDLLIAARNKLTNSTHLFVMDINGNINHDFLLFDRDYNSEPNARTKQPLADLIPDGALAFLQIVPDGENLLLIPRMTSDEIIEVSEDGVVRSIQLQLLSKQTLGSFLSASDSSWKIKTFANTDSNGTLHEGPVYEFNPVDGSAIRRIDMPKEVNALLACEHNEEYTAITTDRDTGRLEILRGHVAK